ncbi:DNA repair exonuclease SbcCD ATPase subunit [Pseudomonas sp. GV105]|uniref:AAA family ATPase n=1 Tax=Pseudomonas sp. GV105 TaxID=2135759 RepID=UPI000D4C6B0C|nr:AAA family ATPase [Pseudomonas sp. GV105]PUB30414.1 DNA repair exonuclease SbcCD ATPase subunit [Pseudomonas sp. GV105]
MSGIYLSRIRIQDFRTFGCFDVDIPAAPGLVLLTGTNGLGKSSFFDAIEWGLTGAVRRFAPYVEKGKFREGDYLTRRGVEAGLHEVKLTFSNGNPIERNANHATPMSSIIAQLAQSDRLAINDLGTYLALTHFLGQAAHQRFTSRDPKDQWQALKGPSGIERLEQVRSGLRGRTTTNAFTRRIDDETSAITKIEKQIAEWQGWQARLDRFRQAARAAGNLTTEEVTARVKALESELDNLLQGPALTISGETLSQRLTGLGNKLAQALLNFTEREAKIESLSDTVGLFITANVNARTDHPVMVRTRQEFDDASTAMAAATLDAQVADAAVTAQQAAIGTIEHNVTLLELARADLNRQIELTNQIGRVQDELSGVSAAIVERSVALAEAESAVRKHTDGAVEVERLRNIAQRASELVESHATLLNLESALSRDTSALESAWQDASVAQMELEPILLERNVLSEQINQALAAQVEAERHVSAIVAAVATIASHIHDDDTNCPVCSTPFPSGELKLLANEAARSIDTRLAEAAAEIERLHSEAAALDAQIDELQAIVDSPAHLEWDLESIRDTETTTRTTLARELNIDLVDLNEDVELGSIAKSREQSARLALTEAATALQLLAAPAAAGKAQRNSITRELEEKKAQAIQISSRLSALRSEDQACIERITVRGMQGESIDSLNTRLSAQRRSFEAARSQLALLLDETVTTKAKIENLREALSTAERALVEAECARVNAEATAHETAHRWTKCGLDGTPSLAGLDKNLGVARAGTATVRVLSDRLQALTHANQDVLLQEEISQVIEAMRVVGGEAGLADPESYLAKLRAEEAVARTAVNLTIDARKAVMRFTEQLKKRAEDYSTQVLAPLNSVIDDFNDAMLSTPGESIQFRAEHRVDTTSFGMSLRSREQVEAALERQKDLPPQVVLSEGQLAANGFSILCAASIAYPWSRWRALLLDDPLQHNDIIHTAAFVDVMRNMVESQGYQLIMSSHDRAESEFIARKFEAAGLACSKIALMAPSDKGVVYEGPEHNQAAKRIIQKQAGNAQLSA